MRAGLSNLWIITSSVSGAPGCPSVLAWTARLDAVRPICRLRRRCPRRPNERLVPASVLVSSPPSPMLAVPRLRTSAGARFIVIRRAGNSNSELRIALRTRSRLSRTLESGRPTIVNVGRPNDTSTSTSTSEASTPTSEAECSRACTPTHPQGRIQTRKGPQVEVSPMLWGVGFQNLPRLKSRRCASAPHLSATARTGKMIPDLPQREVDTPA